MRAFIAIDLPEEIKDHLSLLETKLKQSGADVKWAAPVNIHLTLKFLGDIDDKRINQIIQILDDISSNTPQFYIKLGGIGTFPNIRSPRIIWIGLAAGNNETKEITADLEERIEKIGIPKEDKPFTSHITIGRVKSNLNREKLIPLLTTLTTENDKSNYQFLATKLTLFKSTLTPKGPIYEAVKESNLRTD